MCISWTIKGLISLMHGVTMKISYKAYIAAQCLNKCISLSLKPSETSHIIMSVPEDGLLYSEPFWKYSRKQISAAYSAVLRD